MFSEEADSCLDRLPDKLAKGILSRERTVGWAQVSQLKPEAI